MRAWLASPSSSHSGGVQVKLRNIASAWLSGILALSMLGFMVLCVLNASNPPKTFVEVLPHFKGRIIMNMVPPRNITGEEPFFYVEGWKKDAVLHPYVQEGAVRIEAFRPDPVTPGFFYRAEKKCLLGWVF
jgi:hypothetical protein